MCGTGFCVGAGEARKSDTLGRTRHFTRSTADGALLGVSALGSGEVAVSGGDRDAVSDSVGAYADHTA